MDGQYNSEKQQLHEPAMEMDEDEKQLVSEKIPNQNNWIPEEIQCCILRNLPGKSLMRFKCVNKSWNFRISDSNFMNKTPKLILCDRKSVFLMDFERPGKVRKLDLPTKPKRESVWVKGSCNGLLWITVDKEEILWNPFTGEHKIISSALKHQSIPRTSLLMFTAYGFVYDDATKDYKIICIPPTLRSSKSFIYSVKKDSWETLAEIIPSNTSMTFNSQIGISMKSTSYCYWPVARSNRPRLFGRTDVEDRLVSEQLILGLDVVNSRKVLFPQPPGSVKVKNVIDFKGSLCAVKIDDGQWIIKMWLWKENWVMLMSIDMSQSHLFAHLIYITNDEEVLMIGTRRNLVYAPQSSTEKRFRSVKFCGLDDWHASTVYSETLCSFGN